LKPEAIVMAAAEVKPAVTGTEIKSITKPIEAKQKSYFGIKSFISSFFKASELYLKVKLLKIITSKIIIDNQCFESHLLSPILFPVKLIR
jgi:hypothetical protein